MQLAAIIVIALVVLVVAIDAIARLDERCRPPDQREEGTITTQKIIVDLTRRR
jgi:hypothetical protein